MWNSLLLHRTGSGKARALGLASMDRVRRCPCGAKRVAAVVSGGEVAPARFADKAARSSCIGGTRRR
jgi:threonine dehydratase